MTTPNALPQYPHRVERYAAAHGEPPSPNGAVGLLGGFADSVDKYAEELRGAGYDIPSDPSAEFRVEGVGTWDGQDGPSLGMERIIGSDGTPTLSFTRRNGQDISIVTLTGYKGGHSWKGYSVFSRVDGRDFSYDSTQAQEDSRILRGVYPEERKRGRGERLGHAAAVVGDIVDSFNGSAIDEVMRNGSPRFDRVPSQLEGVRGSTVYEAKSHSERNVVSRLALRAAHGLVALVNRTPKNSGTGRVRI